MQRKDSIYKNNKLIISNNILNNIYNKTDKLKKNDYEDEKILDVNIRIFLIIMLIIFSSILFILCK